MKRFIAGIVVFTLLIVGGAVWIFSKAPAKATLSKEKSVQMAIDHREYSFGTVKLSEGIVEHRYPLKNAGQKDLKIANLASSCACTKVYFKSASGESPQASMKGMSKPSVWVGVLKPGESGEMVMRFDPNFHGPTGVGKIARSLSFETNDPSQSYVELQMTGEVVK